MSFWISNMITCLPQKPLCVLMWRLKSKPSTEFGPPNPSLALDCPSIYECNHDAKAKHHRHGVTLDFLSGK